MTSTSENQSSQTELTAIDSLLVESGQKTITKEQVMMILDSLANSDDPAMVYRFPVVLAICVRRGLELSTQALFGKYWETSPKRQNLEKMYLASVHVLKLTKIRLPGYFDKISESLYNIYGQMLSSGNLQLSNGIRVSLEELQLTLKKYLASVDVSLTESEQSAPDPSQIHTYLDRLFSPKQKELIFKKLKNEFVTKTEREYYSRVVKKKLEAIADSGIREIALLLTRKKL